MSKTQLERFTQETRQLLFQWLESCTRKGKISRNTIAMGIVVFDHFKRSCPVKRSKVISSGGEVSGARSGLGKILLANGVPNSYLKEVTTRQGHQDGQRLFEAFEWGAKLANLAETERSKLLNELVEILREHATQWLRRQHLKLDMDRRQAPATWVQAIIENAKGRSGGVVEQQLIGAKLERRLKGVAISNHPAHAADRQTERAGDFTVSKLIYHVTASPGKDVLQKCAKNIKVGLHRVQFSKVGQSSQERFA